MKKISKILLLVALIIIIGTSQTYAAVQSPVINGTSTNSSVLIFDAENKIKNPQAIIATEKSKSHKKIPTPDSPNIESSLTPETENPQPIITPLDSTRAITTTEENSLLAEPLMQTLNSQATDLNATTTQTLGPNLISNPSVETTDSAGLPTDWKNGSYGTNSRVLTYPVTGYSSAKAIKVTISSLASGDAKWYFSDVPVTPGNTYQISDYYISDTTNIVDIRYKLSDGSYKYVYITTLQPSANYKNFTAQFVVPQNAVSLTIFHLIQNPGNLTTDAYSLNEVITETTPAPEPEPNPDPIPQPAPTSTNLINNPNFEISGANNLPANWNKDRWANNTAVFSYPVPGVGNSKAAKVEITGWISGDAKWSFDHVSVAPGTYTYSDQYISNRASYLTIEYLNSNGSYAYKGIASLPAANSFTPVSVDFIIPENVKSVTVFHLISGIGTLTIDNTSLRKKTASPASGGIFETGGVSLTFDDGWLSQYNAAIPDMDKAGLKGTFYIITHQLSDYGFTNFVSKSQIKSMHNIGHEIGAHTRIHEHLPELTTAEKIDEIAGSKQDLIDMDINPVISFSYPFGEYDAETMQIVKDNDFSAAVSTFTGYVTQIADKFQLRRQSVQVNTTIDQVKQWIDTAVQNKQWVILTFHRVDESKDQYSATPSTFKSIIDYLVQEKVKVVTIAEGIKSIK